MSKKRNGCYPPMAIAALGKANGDRQKGWSEYIRLHFQATGHLSPGCDAKDFYAILDRVLVAALSAIRRCTNTYLALEDGEVADYTPDEPRVSIPKRLFQELVDVVDGHIGH